MATLENNNNQQHLKDGEDAFTGVSKLYLERMPSVFVARPTGSGLLLFSSFEDSENPLMPKMIRQP